MCARDFTRRREIPRCSEIGGVVCVLDPWSGVGLEGGDFVDGWEVLGGRGGERDANQLVGVGGRGWRVVVGGLRVGNVGWVESSGIQEKEVVVGVWRRLRVRRVSNVARIH